MSLPRDRSRLWLLALVALVAATALGGCNLARVAARSSAALSVRAAPGFEQFYDYELAGAAMPATIVQLEGLIRADPSNQRLLLQLTRTYVGYSYGWVEDRVEQLELEEHDYRAGGEQRARANRFYRRAKDLGWYALGLRASGGDAHIAQGESAFGAWLRSSFDDASDAPMLFWTGTAWASAIGSSSEGLSDSADLPFARLLVERSIALDPSYQHAAGTGMLGAVEASVPDGDLERSRAYFDDAIARTDRHALALLVNMANTYAVQAADRALYEQLLHEVLSAEDVDPTARLANLIAKRRARRYLTQTDARFP
jgi:hypothetical protein